MSDHKDWRANAAWRKRLEAIDPRRGRDQIATDFAVMADHAEALGLSDEARRLRHEHAFLPMRIILRWREPDRFLVTPDKNGRVTPRGQVGVTVQGRVEHSFAMGWWPDRVRVWTTIPRWEVSGPLGALSNASDGDSIWDPFDPLCPVRVCLGTNQAARAKFDIRNAPFEVTGPLAFPFPFSPKAGPGDADSISEIVDECETVEQAELLARVMTRHRDDADALVASVLARWSYIDELAEELAS